LVNAGISFVGKKITLSDSFIFNSPSVQSCDPNEISGPLGTGAERYKQPGDWMDYIIYFENKTNATAAAQEISIDLPMDPNLDWDTLELGEIAFGDNIATNFAGKKHGQAEYPLPGRTDSVKMEVAAKDGVLRWYLRSWEPSTLDNFPADAEGGFLPPNDPETHCGEGRVAYRVKVRKDAEPGTVIRASATIRFDDNPEIETDPSWWNTVRVDVPLTVWRFYSKNYKGHFFTIDEEEKDGLIEGNPNWKFEGGAYRAYTNGAAGTAALHRFYSKKYRGHFFTIDEAEMQEVRDTNPNWKYEGIAYYVHPEEVEGSVPVFRFWSKGYRHHFYTIDEEEKDDLIATNPNWKYEGIAFWALPLEEEAEEPGSKAAAGGKGTGWTTGSRAARGGGEDAGAAAGGGRPAGAETVAPGGRDGWLALAGTAEVTTSDGSDGRTVADGDEGTAWSPETADGSWVVLTFADVLEVAEVEVSGEKLPGGTRILISEEADDWQEGVPGAARYVWVLFPASEEPPVVREIRVEE
jgi:hypothetical protein